MSYVRIIDTDRIRRDRHAADAIICRADTVLDSGWFGSAGPSVETRDTLYALQRAVCAGVDASGCEQVLGVAVLPSDIGHDGPADAMRIWPWEDVDGKPVRGFVGSSWVVSVDGTEHDVQIEINGDQFANGDAERSILVNSDDQYSLTPQRARELAGALCAAADELERFEED